MRESASILTIGSGDPTISIDGESTRAADTGVPKVLGSSFRELGRLSPNTTRPASARAEFFARRFDRALADEDRHVDELRAIGDYGIVWNASTQPRFIPPNLKEIVDADTFVASGHADCSDRAPIPSQRHLVADGMAKPLDEQTDEDRSGARPTRRA